MAENSKILGKEMSDLLRCQNNVARKLEPSTFQNSGGFHDNAKYGIGRP
jgi:hypothetical protein